VGNSISFEKLKGHFYCNPHYKVLFTHLSCQCILYEENTDIYCSSFTVVVKYSVYMFKNTTIIIQITLLCSLVLTRLP